MTDENGDALPLSMAAALSVLPPFNLTTNHPIRHLHHRTARVPVVNGTGAEDDDAMFVLNNTTGIAGKDASIAAAYPQYKDNISNAVRVGDTWVRNCSSPFDNIDFENPRIVGSLVPLGIVCLMVIFGNIMVIAAVRITKKMRGATNLFIVSLAWADLMLGMVVLPFSAMYEVFSIWIFGRIWCSIWLAVDVWTCTASILHLVVISLDRYIAVTHPITYPNIMTSKRAKMLILAAWVLSFVICFPPLVGWNEEGSSASIVAGSHTNDTGDFVDHQMDPGTVEILERCMPQCRLIQEPGYVIYSAVGSFYAPMLVMMFFNWRIYRTARKTTKAIRQGWTKVKGAAGEGIGIHRGGGRGTVSEGGGAGVTCAMTPSRTSSIRPLHNSATTGHLLNPSSGGGLRPGAVTQSRRASSTGLAGATSVASPSLRRQKTISEMKLPSSSTTAARLKGRGANTSVAAAAAASVAWKAPPAKGSLLPRSTSFQPNGQAGKKKPKGRLKNMAATSYSEEDDDSECESVGGGSRQRHATSCLIIPLLTVDSSRSNHIDISGSAKTRKDSTSPPEDGESGSSSRRASISRSPRVSHHQPCPNHILGKTYTEQGTQTLKVDRLAKLQLEQVATKQHQQEQQWKLRPPFRWRSKSAQRNDSDDQAAAPAADQNGGQKRRPRSASPCSLEQNRRHQKRAEIISNCFHFRRWTKRGRGMLFKRNRGKGTPPQQDLCMEDLHKSTGLSTANGDAGGAAPKWPNSHMSYVARLGQHQSNVLSAPSGQTTPGSACNSLSVGATASAAVAANKLGKRNIKSQVRRFRMETKAAKTLGIIVGCFICCWFPFFTMYLVTAFCEECVPPLAFSVIFWLGYCNSAINPFIYAAFSRDFRNAFKKILCRFLCNKAEPRQPGALVRMGLVPFAPHTVAIGLADRFPPAAVVTAASENSQNYGGCDFNSSSSNRNSTIRRHSRGSFYPC